MSSSSSSQVSTTCCPSDDVLVRLLEGELPQDSQDELESHVSGCEQCASVIGNLGALGFARHASPDHRALLPVDPQHYVLSEEIARGGMGRILRARDRRLGRDVAIKETFVKTGDGTRRFEREARITARLQHPSIVHILEAGTWPSGEPFFAMPLVAGRSFDRVIADAATLDQRLALVPNALAVADAIAYAHSKGIIHRDLKPRNVLVGDFGETVVIDWGLAKDTTAVEPVIDDGPYRGPARVDDQTRLGTVVGTPGYMPPEQARGEPVDRRADVYALGALLFHVLSGRQPVTGHDSDDVIAKIVDGRVPSLAEVQPGVPRDLLAIVDKAMARAPADRYASARELAEDLRQFQTGQLVSAHHYSVQQLVRRWLRRHRTAVTVAFAATLVLAATAFVSIRRVVRAETVAQDERSDAERHRADAEELMSFMLGDLRQKLEPIGKLDVLDAVAKKAMLYYARRPIAAETANDRRERSAALHNLSDVLRAQGHTVEALAQACNALAITELLVATDPTNTTWQRDLSVRHHTVGAVLDAQGDVDGALAEQRAALAIDTGLLARDPNSAEAQRDLSVTHERLAELFDERGRFAEALAESRASLELTDRVALLVHNGETERDAAIGHERVAWGLMRVGDLDAALTEHHVALDIRRQLVARDPSNATWQRDLAGHHNELGDLLLTRNDVAGAVAEFRAALAIHEMLTHGDPSNADWQSDLGTSHYNMGRVLVAQHDPAGALVEYRMALAIQDRLLAQDPTHADRLRDIELTHAGIGVALAARGDRPGMLAEDRLMLELATKLSARDPDNMLWLRDVAISHERFGHALETSDPTAALAEHRASLALRERLALRNPTNQEWQNDIGVSHYNIAELLAPRDPAAALIEHRAARAVTEAVLVKDAQNTARQHDLADSDEQISKLELKLGQRVEAQADARASLTLLERFAAADPKDPSLHADVARLRGMAAH